MASSGELSRRDLLRYSSQAALFIAAGGLLKACSPAEEVAEAPTDDDPDDGPPEEEEEERLTFLTSTSPAGWGAAVTMGMAEIAEAEHNTDVQIRTMSPTDAEVAMLAGALDVALFGILSIVRAHDEGHDVVMIQPLSGAHSSVMTGEDNPAETLEDLVGSRIGVLPRVSAQYNDLLQICAELDIDLEGDFDLQLGAADLAEGLFEQGQLDAFATFEPNQTRLLRAGGTKEIIQFSEFWEDMFGAPLVSWGWVAEREWAQSEKARRLRLATEDSGRRFMDSLEPYEQFAELFGFEDDPEAIELFAERTRKILMFEWTDDVLENLQFRLDRATELEVIDRQVDIEELILT